MVSVQTYGEMLKQLRQCARLSLRALAAEAYSDHTHLSHLENGRGRGSKDLAQRLDTALNAQGGLVAAYTSSQRRGDKPSTAGIQAASVITELAMSAEESARFLRRGTYSVDETTIEQLTDDVQHLAIRFLDEPPLVVAQSLTQRRRDLFDLLDQRQRPQYLADLYSLAGYVCAMLAHACADLHSRYAAETHARTALLLADYASDSRLTGYVRWCQAQTAHWAGDHQRAAKYARAGLDIAAAPQDILRLASQQARAYAAEGNHRDAENALTTAQGAFEQLDQLDAPHGVLSFDAGKASYYAGEAYNALGNHNQGLTHATRALEIFDQTNPCPEFTAAAHAVAAKAHLGLGDLDGSRDAINPVLALPVELRTQPITSRIARISDQLLRNETQQAQELREEIGLFSAYTAATEIANIEE